MPKVEHQEKKRRAKRSFTDEFRAGAEPLVLDEGKTVAQVAHARLEPASPHRHP